MAINLVTLHADKIDEKNSPISVSAAGTNQDYSWDGVKTIKVTSIGVGTMKDYDREAGYGAVATADSLSTTEQVLTLSKDRAFRLKLDKMDENESKIKSEEVIARQLREVVLPEIEAHRFKVMLSGTKASNKLTATDSAYADFLKAQELLDDAFAPEVSRIAFATPAFINKIKLDPSFTLASELMAGNLIKGQVGEIDGIPVVKVNKAWLTDGTSSFNLLIADKNATVAPIKLADYEALNHPDYRGTVFQGSFYYDAFVLNNKAGNLAAVKVAP